MIALFALLSTASCLIPQYLKPDWNKYIDIPKLKDTITVHFITVKNVFSSIFTPIYRGIIYAFTRIYNVTVFIAGVIKNATLSAYNKVMNYIAPVPESKSGFDNAREIADEIDAAKTQEEEDNKTAEIPNENKEEEPTPLSEEVEVPQEEPVQSKDDTLQQDEIPIPPDSETEAV